MIIDHFLDSYQDLKEFSKTCVFKDMKNPYDDVVYPYICEEIPETVKKEVFHRLCEVKQGQIENPTIFLRMSPEGVHVPHIAHTDTVMGNYSCMVYLHEASGTAFLSHIQTGVAFEPNMEMLKEVVISDMNRLEAWQAYQIVHGKENRALIFDAARFHCALPGFGTTQANSRIVLTCFYD